MTNWFDEVEERHALQQLQDFAYVPKTKQWSEFPRAGVQETTLPARDVMDEIYEHESYVLDVGQAFQQLPDGARQDHSCAWSVATKVDDESDWHWQEVFQDINIALDTLDENLKASPATTKTLFIKHQMKAGIKPGCRKVGMRRYPLGRRERHWLRRHGRHLINLVGWDGSPPELQPLFQQDDFSKVYYSYVTDIANKKFATMDPEVNKDAADFEHNQRPSWEETSWTADPRPDSFSVQFTETQTFTGPESSEEENETDETAGMGRAAKQALKKETPWRTISAEDRPKFIKSNQEEWSEWLKWSSCKAVYPQPGEIDEKLILRSRICYRWKPKDGGKWFKPKSRIVVLGFLDPHLPLLSRDAPVLAKSTFILIVQWAASHGVSLWNGDCKSAFLQGEADTERPTQIYMKPPQDPIALDSVPEWRHPLLLYALSAPVYGQANAPRRWFLHVLHVLLDKNWVQHSLDPCCFLQIEGETVTAVLGIHVDDIICCCLNGYEHHLEVVKQSFEWGSEWEKDDFVFTGRRLRRMEDGSFRIDQEHYVADVQLTRIKHADEELLSDHPELITEFRSGIGSLQWLAGTTRGDLAADVSLLQKPPRELTVGDLKEINRVLKYVRATAEAYFTVNPIPLSELIFVAYGDSGWANAPGNKSQGGLVVLATTKQCLETPQRASMLEWKSYRHQRVLRSTLAAEAASLDRAFDVGNFLACTFSEMTSGGYKATTATPMYEVIPVTDARSLWDAIHRLSTTFQEKRVEIDVAALRQSCRGLRWVPTEQQRADALTKRSHSLRDSFRKWAQAPVVVLTDSRSAEHDIDSAAWKTPMSTKEKSNQCHTDEVWHESNHVGMTWG